MVRAHVCVCACLCVHTHRRPHCRLPTVPAMQDPPPGLRLEGDAHRKQYCKIIPRHYKNNLQLATREGFPSPGTLPQNWSRFYFAGHFRAARGQPSAPWDPQTSNTPAGATRPLPRGEVSPVLCRTQVSCPRHLTSASRAVATQISVSNS